MKGRFNDHDHLKMQIIDITLKDKGIQDVLFNKSCLGIPHVTLCHSLESPTPLKLLIDGPYIRVDSILANPPKGPFRISDTRPVKTECPLEKW